MNPYKSFPNANLMKDWGKLIELSLEEVKEIEASWMEIHKLNQEKSKELIKKRMKKQKEMDDMMTANKIDIFNRKRSGLPTVVGYKAWYKNNVVDVITAKYPQYDGHMPVAHIEKKEVNGIVLYNNQSPTRIVKLYENIMRDYKGKKKASELNDKLLIESIKYANERSIDIEDLDSEGIIQIVDAFAKRVYQEEQVPNGTELYLKHGCYECNSYTVGNHRCSCGNRRISVVVEGNLIDGYEYYLEAY